MVLRENLMRLIWLGGHVVWSSEDLPLPWEETPPRGSRDRRPFSRAGAGESVTGRGIPKPLLLAARGPRLGAGWAGRALGFQGQERSSGSQRGSGLSLLLRWWSFHLKSRMSAGDFCFYVHLCVRSPAAALVDFRERKHSTCAREAWVILWVHEFMTFTTKPLQGRCQLSS